MKERKLTQIKGKYKKKSLKSKKKEYCYRKKLNTDKNGMKGKTFIIRLNIHVLRLKVGRR